MSWAALVLALGTIGLLVPPEGPSISALTPSHAHPGGGQIVTIEGRNFQSPIRVTFELAGGSSYEAFLTSSTPTQIFVVTPAVLIPPPAQAVEATIVVVTNAGTDRERRASSKGPFTFVKEKLTPQPFTVTPNMGPTTGGTRVSIFGEGFQAPVQVLFGSSEARVIMVSYSEILVLVPQMLEQSVVDVEVRNVVSHTSGALPTAFRYRPKSQIASVFPASAPETQPTRVTIEGVGFQAPVAVIIGGVAAQPIVVNGTRIIALVSPERTCNDRSGPVIVTNIAGGDEAEAPIPFTYLGTQPEIVHLEPAQGVAGETVAVTVSPAVSGGQFTIEGVPVTPLFTRGDWPGTTFVLPVPSAFAFPTRACADGGTRSLPVRTTLVYAKNDTSCMATTTLVVAPPSAERCSTPRTVLP